MDSVWNKGDLPKNHFDKLSSGVVKTCLILLWDGDMAPSSLLFKKELFLWKKAGNTASTNLHIWVLFSNRQELI